MGKHQTTSPIGGYHGCYLRVDLTQQRSHPLPISESDLRTYLGGSGLGVRLLLEENLATIDPFSPAAGLAFVFSPLVGSPVTTSAKFAVVSKSPLTDRFNDALASSRFAIAGKKTGHDAIVITGRATEPSILLIENDRIRIHPAHDLIGKSCRETEVLLKQQYGNDFQFAIIGPAGERLVRYATISHDRRHAGRGGSGAVLGSKNIKAVGVRGDREVHWHDSHRLLELAKRMSAKSLGPATAKYRELGTASNLLLFNRLGALPTRNFQKSQFDKADQIAPETLTATKSKTRAYCAACTIGCEHIYELESHGQGVRLEYENLFSMGSLCEISDPDIVLKASQLCDDYGLDTISTGGTVAFAMECVERGVLAVPWLRFGDGKSLLKAIHLIGERRELGDALAEGSRRFANQLGHSTLDFAPQVKGLEIPGYDPRSLQTMALGFAVNSRGADHNRSGAYEADFSNAVDRYRPTLESVRMAIETEDRSAIMDSMIICKFLRGIFDDFYTESAEILSLVSGWDLSAEDLKQSAKRIVEAKKLFNILAGWKPEEDILPNRFFKHAQAGDEQDGIEKDRFQELIHAYNVQRGWTANGWLS